MGVLDFTEIPSASGNDGTQDTFELLARDFLSNVGFRIISSPNRGADGGKDMLAEETRPGKFSTTAFRWLVSCKHYAHSGKAVSPSDESNVIDRLTQFKAQGFLGFYSTVASSGLSNRFDEFRGRYEIEVMDHRKIENELLKAENFDIARRYFPVSSSKWTQQNTEPTTILGHYEALTCDVCGRDLLAEIDETYIGGIIAFVNSISTRQVTDYSHEKVLAVYAACKGRCDRLLENRWQNHDGTTGWVDVSDVKSPIEYLRWNMAILNELKSGTTEYTDEAFDKLKIVLLRLAQFVVRKPTESELDRFQVLRSIPRL